MFLPTWMTIGMRVLPSYGQYLAEQLMVKEHLAVVGRKDDDRIMIGLIIFQRGDQRPN